MEKREINYEIKVTQKSPILKLKKYKKTNLKLLSQKLFNPLIVNLKQKKLLLSLMKKIQSFNRIQKSLLLPPNLNLNLHLPISLDQFTNTVK